MNAEQPTYNNITLAFFVRSPWLVYVIFGFNILVFLVMLKASLMPVRWTLEVGNDTASLINFGAKTNYLLLQQKQWFRLVTPIFIHIGLLHLFTNSYTLWVVGPVVEKFYGAARFALLYLLAGIGGVLGSLVGSSNPHIPSAGASGALFGLFGVLLVVSYKYRHELPDPFRRELRKNIIVVLILNFLFGIGNNAGWFAGGQNKASLHLIDMWGHLGGLLTGTILAMILPYLAPEKKYASWSDKLILAGCFLLVSFCFLRAYQLRPFLFQR